MFFVVLVVLHNTHLDGYPEDPLVDDPEVELALEHWS